jgi:hypothetical protein
MHSPRLLLPVFEESAGHFRFAGWTDDRPGKGSAFANRRREQEPDLPRGTSDNSGRTERVVFGLVVLELEL